MKTIFGKDLEQLLFMSTEHDRRDSGHKENQQGFSLYIIS